MEDNEENTIAEIVMFETRLEIALDLIKKTLDDAPFDGLIDDALCSASADIKEAIARLRLVDG